MKPYQLGITVFISIIGWRSCEDSWRVLRNAKVSS